MVRVDLARDPLYHFYIFGLPSQPPRLRYYWRQVLQLLQYLADALRRSYCHWLRLGRLAPLQLVEISALSNTITFENLGSSISIQSHAAAKSTAMSRPFSRITNDQGPGSRGLTGAGSGAGNGIGNGVGTGVRGWWRNSRESMNSNESAPKSPSQGNEMVSVGSNFAGLSPVITTGTYHAPTSNSPVSPGHQSNSILFAPLPLPPVGDSAIPPERPRPAAVRNETIGTGGLDMIEVVQTQPQVQAQTQPRRPVDIEGQHTVPTETGGWWWQRESLKGLQTKLFTCLVAGIFLAITLSICQYTFNWSFHLA